MGTNVTGSLTDQAAVAVALARAVSAAAPATAAHLLIGLATEPEGRAGRRLRERASAAAVLLDRGAATPAPSLDAVVRQAATAARPRAATTVDLLDAAITVGGDDIGDLLAAAGYQRDLDGWVAGHPLERWFDDAETYGLQPGGDDLLDATAARVVAQVRAVGGGAVEVLIAAAAAPDVEVVAADPSDLAAVAQRLRPDRGTDAGQPWDAGLASVVAAAKTLRDGEAVTVRDLVRAALVAGGDGARLVLELGGATR